VGRWRFRVNVPHGSVFPKHSVRGGISSYRLITGAGDANRLPVVINCRGSARSVTSDQRQFLDLVSSRTPNHRAKLKDLRGLACRIGSGIFCPSSHLSPIVRTGGVAVVSPQCGKSPHAIQGIPYESQTGIACTGCCGEKGRATPVFASRLWNVCLGDAGNQSPVILHRPSDTAVGSTKGPKVACRSVSPQHRVPALIVRQIRIARYPDQIINAVTPADRSTERREVSYGVTGRPPVLDRLRAGVRGRVLLL